MKTSVKYLVIVSIAAVLVASGIYFLSSVQNGNSRAENPENFIPSESVFYAMVSTGNTSYYPFIVNGSLGVVVHAPLATITSGTASSKLNLSSPKFSTGTSYDGFTVFSISNVDLLTVFNLGINNSLMHLLTPLFNLGFLSSVRNSTIYASNPSSAVSVIGQLQALRASLNCFTVSSSIQSGMLATPENANISMHYTNHGSGFSSLSLNLTKDNISIKLGLASPSVTMAVYAASLEIHVSGLRFDLLSPTMIFILITSENPAVSTVIGDLIHYLDGIAF
ncbi:MAG: hypothetical protein QW597_06905 [Thermoplasmataceae archaeon]